MKNQNEVPVTHKGDYGKTKVRYHYEIYYIDDNGRDVLSFVSGSLFGSPDDAFVAGRAKLARYNSNYSLVVFADYSLPISAGSEDCSYASSCYHAFRALRAAMLSNQF